MARCRSVDPRSRRAGGAALSAPGPARAAAGPLGPHLATLHDADAALVDRLEAVDAIDELVQRTPDVCTEALEAFAAVLASEPAPELTGC